MHSRQVGGETYQAKDGLGETSGGFEALELGHGGDKHGFYHGGYCKGGCIHQQVQSLMS